MEKSRQQTEDSLRKLEEESQVVVDPNDTLKLSICTEEPTGKSRKRRKPKKKNSNSKNVDKENDNIEAIESTLVKPNVSNAEDEGSSADENETQDEPQLVGKGLAAIRQRDLVARAFADDHVIAVSALPVLLI